MNDINGNPINAHGAGILFHNNTYFWYGEIKNGATRKVEYVKHWECYRTDASGVSCYSSKDLINWKYEGVALAPNMTDSASDIHFSKVIERPKVIYNNKTKKFVMWMHVDSEDYRYACAGIAISDSPVGPFKYLKSIQPNGRMSKDMTLFKDTDEKAYHIFSSEKNATMHIVKLSDDYLSATTDTNRIFIKKFREAPALFKHNNKYYLLTSGCTGWSPNRAMVSETENLMGEWSPLYDPCIGPKSETTFDSQSTFVLPINPSKGEYLYMGDRWNKLDLKESKYVWLPLRFKNGKVVIEWKNKWSLSKYTCSKNLH